MDLERRVTNLENLVNGLAKTINNNKFYDLADKAGIRQTEGTHSNDLLKHSSDIDFIAMETGVDLAAGEEEVVE